MSLHDPLLHASASTSSTSSSGGGIEYHVHGDTPTQQHHHHHLHNDAAIRQCAYHGWSDDDDDDDDDANIHRTQPQQQHRSAFAQDDGRTTPTCTRIVDDDDGDDVSPNNTTPPPSHRDPAGLDEMDESDGGYSPYRDASFMSAEEELGRHDLQYVREDAIRSYYRKAAVKRGARTHNNNNNNNTSTTTTPAAAPTSSSYPSPNKRCGRTSRPASASSESQLSHDLACVEACLETTFVRLRRLLLACPTMRTSSSSPTATTTCAAARRGTHTTSAYPPDPEEESYSDDAPTSPSSSMEEALMMELERSERDLAQATTEFIQHINITALRLMNQHHYSMALQMLLKAHALTQKSAGKVFRFGADEDIDIAAMNNASDRSALGVSIQRSVGSAHLHHHVSQPQPQQHRRRSGDVLDDVDDDDDDSDVGHDDGNEDVCSLTVPYFATHCDVQRRLALSVCENNFGLYHFQLAEYELAAQRIRRALRLEDQLHVASIGITYFNYAQAQHELRQRKDALEHATLAEEAVERRVHQLKDEWVLLRRRAGALNRHNNNNNHHHDASSPSRRPPRCGTTANNTTTKLKRSSEDQRVLEAWVRWRSDVCLLSRIKEQHGRWLMEEQRSKQALMYLEQSLRWLSIVDRLSAEEKQRGVMLRQLVRDAKNKVRHEQVEMELYSGRTPLTKASKTTTTTSSSRPPTAATTTTPTTSHGQRVRSKVVTTLLPRKVVIVDQVLPSDITPPRSRAATPTRCASRGRYDAYEASPTKQQQHTKTTNKGVRGVADQHATTTATTTPSHSSPTRPPRSRGYTASLKHEVLRARANEERPPTSSSATTTSTSSPPRVKPSTTAEKKHKNTTTTTTCAGSPTRLPRPTTSSSNNNTSPQKNKNSNNNVVRGGVKVRGAKGALCGDQPLRNLFWCISVIQNFVHGRYARDLCVGLQRRGRGGASHLARRRLTEEELDLADEDDEDASEDVGGPLLRTFVYAETSPERGDLRRLLAPDAASGEASADAQSSTAGMRAEDDDVGVDVERDDDAHEEIDHVGVPIVAHNDDDDDRVREVATHEVEEEREALVASEEVGPPTTHDMEEVANADDVLPTIDDDDDDEGMNEVVPPQTSSPPPPTTATTAPNTSHDVKKNTQVELSELREVQQHSEDTTVLDPSPVDSPEPTCADPFELHSAEDCGSTNVLRQAVAAAAAAAAASSSTTSGVVGSGQNFLASVPDVEEVGAAHVEASLPPTSHTPTPHMEAAPHDEHEEHAPATTQQQQEKHHFDDDDDDDEEMAVAELPEVQYPLEVPLRSSPQREECVESSWIDAINSELPEVAEPVVVVVQSQHTHQHTPIQVTAAVPATSTPSTLTEVLAHHDDDAESSMLIQQQLPPQPCVREVFSTAAVAPISCIEMHPQPLSETSSNMLLDSPSTELSPHLTTATTNHTHTQAYHNTSVVHGTNLISILHSHNTSPVVEEVSGAHSSTADSHSRTSKVFVFVPVEQANTISNNNNSNHVPPLPPVADDDGDARPAAITPTSSPPQNTTTTTTSDDVSRAAAVAVVADAALGRPPPSPDVAMPSDVAPMIMMVDGWKRDAPHVVATARPTTAPLSACTTLDSINPLSTAAPHSSNTPSHTIHTSTTTTTTTTTTRGGGAMTHERRMQLPRSLGDDISSGSSLAFGPSNVSATWTYVGNAQTAGDLVAAPLANATQQQQQHVAESNNNNSNSISSSTSSTCAEVGHERDPTRAPRSKGRSHTRKQHHTCSSSSPETEINNNHNNNNNSSTEDASDSSAREALRDNILRSEAASIIQGAWRDWSARMAMRNYSQQIIKDEAAGVIQLAWKLHRARGAPLLHVQ